MRDGALQGGCQLGGRTQLFGHLRRKTVAACQQGPVLMAFNDAGLPPLIETMVPHADDAVAIVVHDQDFDR